MSETEPMFQGGDEVVVTSGDFKGRYGVVWSYEGWCDRYLVNLPEIHQDGFFSFETDELSRLDPGDVEQDSQEDEDEEVDEILVPAFGMSVEAFERHLEYLLMRSLEHVGKVGPEQAFFGFQEFEGKTPAEILVTLMLKLEEGMAMFAQTHILIGRTITALETLNDPNE